MAQEDEDTTVLRFMEFLRAQDDGYEGSYEEWHWETYGAEAVIAAARRRMEPKDEIEQVLNTASGLPITLLGKRRDAQFPKAPMPGGGGGGGGGAAHQCSVRGLERCFHFTGDAHVSWLCQVLYRS